MWEIIAFLIGLVFGSFANVVAWRLPENWKAIFLARSHCPHCRKILAWYDLIPLLSYLVLQGQCRHCKKAISWHYFLVELLTGLSFALLCHFYGFSWSSLLLYFLVVCLMIVVAFDLKDNLIPDLFVGLGFIFALFWRLWGPTDWLYVCWGLGGSLVFFTLLAGLGRGKWMGWGDVKLVGLLALWLAYPKIIVGLFLAFFVGALVGVWLLITKEKKWQDEVPFGPFLILGALVAFFWGQYLIKWYLGIY